jgi:regulator of replication initiation timing
VKVNYIRTRHKINEECSRTRTSVPRSEVLEVHEMAAGASAVTSAQQEHSNAVNQAVVEHQVNERTKSIAESNTALTAENADLKKRLSASESLLHEALINALNLKMKVDQFRTKAEQFDVLNRRHSLAKAVIEDLNKKVKSLANESKLRIAAEKLAKSLMSVATENKKKAYVERLLSRESKSFADEVRKDLMTCKTMEEVNERLLSLKRIVGKVRETRDDRMLADLSESRNVNRGSRRVTVRASESRTNDDMHNGIQDVNEDRHRVEDEDQTPPELRESLLRTQMVTEAMSRR